MRSTKSQSSALSTPAMTRPSRIGPVGAPDVGADHLVARGALAHVFRAGAEVGFTAAPARVIDREDDHGASGGFHAPQHFLARFPGIRGVELIPDRPPESGVHFFHRERRRRGKHLERPAGSWLRGQPPIRRRRETIPRRWSGMRKIGLLKAAPKSSTRMSTLVASRRRRGRSWTCWKASRLAWTVRSPSTPLTM